MFLAVFACELSSVDILWAILSMADLPPPAADAGGDDEDEESGHRLQQFDTSALYTKALQLTSSSPPAQTAARASTTLAFPSNFPSEKRIPATQFVVDGFRWAGPWSLAYFLSHFHSDHYAGLTPLWNKGIIFCSHITAKLLVEHLNVSQAFVFALPMREKVTIDGCEVTLVEANHCPGAVQFLFRVSSTSDGKEYQRYVHTGDMRYCPSFKNEACLCDFIGADAVFLDTTYCNPRFVFPTQQESVDYVAATVLRFMQQQGGTKRHTLFLIATYVIGKEKILMTVAKHCKCLIYVSEKKLSLLKCLNLEGDHVFTSNSALTNVHVVGWNFLGQTWPYFRPNFANMEKMMQENNYTRVVGFVPTGWTYELKREVFSIRKKEPFEIHLVPYSEHSNYHELREYVRFLKPQKVIPTVGLEGEGMDGKAVAAMRKHFRNLVDEVASKRNFLKSYNRKTSGMLASACKTAAYQSYCKDRLISKQGSSLVIQVNRDNQAFSPDKSPQEQLLLKQDLSAEPNSQQKRFEAAFGRNARKRRERIEDNVAENGDVGYPFERQSHSTLLSLGFPACVDLKDVAIENAMNFPCEGDELEQATEMHLSPTLIVRNVEGESIKDTPIKHEPIQDNSLQNSYEQFTPPAEISEKFVHVQPASSKSHSEGWYAVCIPSSQTAPLNISKSKDSSKTSFPFVTKRENVMNSVSSVKKRAKIQSPFKGTLQSFEKDRATQSSMLDFFKTVRESTSFEAPLALPTLSRNTSLLENDPCTAPECNKSQTHGTDDQYVQRRDEINQLLLILDGGISAEHAIFLLEKADGDVGVALDLYEAEKKSEIAYFLTNAGESSVTSKDSRHSYNEILQSIHRPKENLSNLDPKQTDAVSGSAIHSVASPDFSEPVSSSSLGSNKADVSLRSPCKTQAVLIRNHNTTFRSVAIPIGDYHPIRDSCWKVGEPAPYLHLARAFDLVEQESGRLRIIDMLCNMFRSLLSLSPEAVLPAAYLTVNRIAPEYEHVDLNIGGNIVTAAISEVAGVPRAKLREMYASVGDLGDVAQACRQKQSVLKLPEHLSIGFVFSTLKQVSKESGSGSGERKKRLVINLLRACREKEMKYIVRTLVQNMRIGAMMKSVLSGLAQAVSLHHTCPYEQVVGKSLDSLQKKFQEDSASVLEAYNFLPNLEILLPALITSGVSELAQHITIAPGIPIKPMLAKITNGIQDLVDNFLEKTFTCEYKYDGQRAQIHMLSDGSVRIFSRNCEETTSRFPDVVNIIQMSAAKTRSFIIDTEVVAVDRDNGNKLMSFQHLSTRERGTRDGAPVDVRNIKVDVCVFAFDMMYANNQSLVKLSLNERRQRMHELFPKGRPGYFEFAKEITVEPGSDSMELVVTSQRVEAFLDEAIAASCEGLMAKALIEDSVYRASKRSDSWLKIKRDYVEGLHDTLDLVPIGAWNGNGRKAGWYSPFLLACYDPGREEYQSVCRVMSGFTDTFYKEMKEYFSNHLLGQKAPYYRTGEEPDVWFSAEVVWEIRGADFTISPVHQAAIGYIHHSRGISMRFPRFMHTRSDKNPEDASTPSDIAELYNQQTRKLDVSRK